VVAPAGTYLARVTYAKVSGSRRHLILDGGLHHHAGAAGIGSVIKRSFPIVNATRLRGEHPTIVYSIGGSLCTPADEFCREYELPATAQGDCIAVLSSGAYGYTFSQLGFLSHNKPAEILVLGDEMHLIREATTPEGVLVGQHGLPY
jgi:diaminopimelate decarboxylase